MMEIGKIVPVLLLANDRNGETDIVVKPTNTTDAANMQVVPGSWLVLLTRAKHVRRTGGYIRCVMPPDEFRPRPNIANRDEETVAPSLEISPAYEETYIASLDWFLSFDEAARELFKKGGGK